jgi:hypothetical protein
MTAKQYRDALDRLGLSQIAAAKLFRVDARTSRRWAQYGVTGAVEILMRLLLAGKIKLHDLE